MKTVLGKLEPQVYALMRIVVGLLFFCHGGQKILGLFGGMNGHTAPMFSKFWAAGLIEIVVGIMLMLGIYAGIAAFIGAGQMAVAYFTVHFPRGFWPIQNGGELAVLYCWIFLYIAAKGSGVWSIKRG